MNFTSKASQTRGRRGNRPFEPQHMARTSCLGSFWIQHACYDWPQASKLPRLQRQVQGGGIGRAQEARDVLDDVLSTLGRINHLSDTPDAYLGG